MNVYGYKPTLEKSRVSLSCPDCGASEWYIDLERGQYHCSACGLKFTSNERKCENEQDEEDYTTTGTNRFS